MYLHHHLTLILSYLTLILSSRYNPTSLYLIPRSLDGVVLFIYNLDYVVVYNYAVCLLLSMLNNILVMIIIPTLLL